VGKNERYGVLLVDDADDLRLMLRLNLEGSGRFAVVGEAADGVEGTELAREQQPDLVLLDIAMPVQDGFEALPHIREAAPDARVVVLSSFEEQRLGRKASELGATAFLEKSMPPDRLLERLLELMR
jgi:DNA-binding NarL/FixJ family response regulator